MFVFVFVAVTAAFLVTLVLGAVGLGQVEPLDAVAGLLDRVAVVVASTWLTALAIRSLRSV
ncbi:hypothetical protein [Dactylosporangium darangshiense]|uniref:Uncharacterized protein n=1 Tax=Dactylosporangium darangshiense TaxID=579108 RepID=A0ABP8DWI1_9ACTN